MGKHCDVAHVVDPQYRRALNEDLQNVPPSDTIVALNQEALPNTLNHLLQKGKYQLHLRIAAANCDPVEKVITFVNSGTWSQDEGIMFGSMSFQIS